MMIELYNDYKSSVIITGIQVNTRKVLSDT